MLGLSSFLPSASKCSVTFLCLFVGGSMDGEWVRAQEELGSLSSAAAQGAGLSLTRCFGGIGWVWVLDMTDSSSSRALLKQSFWVSGRTTNFFPSLLSEWLVCWSIDTGLKNELRISTDEQKDSGFFDDDGIKPVAAFSAREDGKEEQWATDKWSVRERPWTTTRQKWK